jgi:hypothetical protein
MNTTIKTLAFSVIASFVFMGGCVSKLTSVNFDYPSEAVIATSAQQNVGTQTFGETVVTSDLKKSLEENNTSIDLLDELKLKSAEVTIEDDSMATFDDIENVQLWVSTDGQPEVLIASKNAIPNGLRSVKLDVNNSENLANYIKADKFTYRIKGTNSAAVKAMNLKVHAIWKVQASAK